MYRISIWSFLLALALAHAACFSGADDPTDNQAPPIEEDVGADDAGPEDVTEDVIDGDATSTDAEASPEVGPDDVGPVAPDVPDVADVADEPPSPDPWGCAPEVALDEVRYVAVEELDGDLFVDELRAMVDNHDAKDYFAARDFMFHNLEVNDDAELECIYTDERVSPDGSNTPGGVFNTEHVWPQSRGAGDEPMRSDVHHLFPCNMIANERRAAYEFGNVDCDELTCDWSGGGSYLGPSADDGRNPVFQVRPERRGDTARAILYFSLRYERSVSAEEESVLRDWHCEDPPDYYEQIRNDRVENFQGNRNPFIDRPDFVDRIAEF